MHRNTSRDTMHAAAARIAARYCRTHSDEAGFEEWFGAHPLDTPEHTGGWARDERRRTVRAQNLRTGKRYAFVCGREDRARTKSTRQLRHERDEALETLLTDDWHGPTPEALTTLRTAERVYARALELFENTEHPAPTDRARVLRQLAALVHEAQSAALATCDPRALDDFAAACRRLAERLAESVTNRADALAPATPEVWAPADLAPTLDSGEPPGLDPTPDALTRRATLTVRPTVERLTCTLALAPGAPSRAVCA